MGGVGEDKYINGDEHVPEAGVVTYRDDVENMLGVLDMIEAVGEDKYIDGDKYVPETGVFM